MRAIDLFAGAGGFTAGARLAGVDVLWAANHWQLAVSCHAMNNGDVEHVCQDLHQADWTRTPACDLVLASPCCQGHTRARGRERAHHDASRSTAWAVVSCCEYHKPLTFIVENVPEFLGWSLYPAWKLAMQSLGYVLTSNVLDAADAGVPQHRRRLFIVGARKEVSIATPDIAHVPVSSILEFDAGSWSPVSKRGRSDKTMARVRNGRCAFGERFVMPYYGSGSGLTGRDIGRPIGTITTRDRWAIVDGQQMRMLNVSEYTRGMGFAAGYQLPGTRADAIHLLGNAVPPPLAQYVVSETVKQLAA